MLGGAAAMASTTAAIWFWPTRPTQAAYPFARRVGGAVDPLWNVPPEKVLATTAEDASRLEQLLPLLDHATHRREALEPRLSSARTGELSANDREQLRQLWWQVFEPILAIDELKSRYSGWYRPTINDTPSFTRAVTHSASPRCARKSMLGCACSARSIKAPAARLVRRSSAAIRAARAHLQRLAKSAGASE